VVEGGSYGIGSHFLMQCPECRLLNAVSTTVPLVVVLEILVVLLVLVVLTLLTLLKLLTILSGRWIPLLKRAEGGRSGSGRLEKG